MNELAKRVLDLHRPGDPLLIPNPWDAGSAMMLASLGFEALATTSSGFAATLGRVDNSVGREESLGHSAAIVAATALPVSADLETGSPTMPRASRKLCAELAAAGVSRISVGGWFAFSALAALLEAATELRERGTHRYIDAARGGAAATARAFAE